MDIYEEMSLRPNYEALLFWMKNCELEQVITYDKNSGKRRVKDVVKDNSVETVLKKFRLYD